MLSRYVWTLRAAALSVLVSACATSERRVQTPAVENRSAGKVSGAAIEASAAEQYQPVAGVRYELPVAIPDNPLPIYPPELLSRRLPPVTVAVQLIVDGAGAVVQAQELDESPADYRPFVAAVKSATSQWRFLPLVQIKDGPGKTRIVSGDTSTEYEGRASALPFHQDYAFEFSQVDGKAAVTSQQESTPAER